jgi:hypothetical protein
MQATVSDAPFKLQVGYISVSVSLPCDCVWLFLTANCSVVSERKTLNIIIIRWTSLSLTVARLRLRIENRHLLSTVTCSVVIL